MAATARAWSKPGAWALDSEENETELLHQPPKVESTNEGTAAALADFPSLATAATTKAKKKKGQTLSLQEFTSYGSAKRVQNTQSVGLTPEDLMQLPTGPRQRTAEELDRTKLGGGFRSYASNSFDRSSRASSDETRRQGGFGRDSSREFAPSRADETDDWAAAKKLPSANGFERRESRDRGGFFSDSQSRADDSDSWVSNKTFHPSDGRRFERRGGFESNGGADSDNWLKKKEEDGRRFGGSFDSLRDRRGGYENGRGGTAGSDTWGKREEGSGNGRPRLNLQPRTLPLHEPQKDGPSAAKPKGSSPFGDARPREEVLKEKGMDWKEIDEKLESMKVKDVTKGEDGPSGGKRSFGNDDENSNLAEDRTDRSWRRSEIIDDNPSSVEQSGPTNAEDDAVVSENKDA